MDVGAETALGVSPEAMTGPMEETAAAAAMKERTMDFIIFMALRI
jgi:hypothetical protein